MADDTEIFGVELDARLASFEKSMIQAANRTDANLNRIQKKFDTTNKLLHRGLGFGGFDANGRRAMRDAERQVQQVAGALAAAFSAREVSLMADEYTALQNRLRDAGLEGQRMAGVQDHLFATATRNGVAVSSLGDLYGSTAMATADLGVKQGDLLTFIDGVSASLRVQGKSAAAVQGSLLQLGQALGGGIVRAEEFNSILEGTPVIARAAAAGMGLSVAQLRKQVIDGKVTSEAFFAALMKGFPEVEKRATAATLTISQSLTGLRNELVKYVGQSDDAVDASRRIAGAIEALASNLDTILPILATLAGFFGVRYVAGVTAATAASMALSVRTAGLGASLMGLAGGPLGIAATAVAALTMGLVALAAQNTDSALAVRALQLAEERAAPAKTQLEKLTRELAGASTERAAAIREEIRALIDLQRVELARLAAKKVAAEDAARRNGSESVSASFGGEVGTSFQRQVNEQVAAEASKPRLPGDGPLLDTAEVRQANAALEAQWKIVDSMEGAFRDATEEAARLNRTTGAGKKDNGAAARAAEQRRRAAVDMEAEVQLQEAQLANDLDRVRVLEREASVRQRTRALIDSGIEKDARAAKAQAEALQQRIDAALDKQMEREGVQARRALDLELYRIEANHERVRAIEAAIEKEERVTFWQQKGYDLVTATTMATLDLVEMEGARAKAAQTALTAAREQHALTVAQLSGNERLTKQLQDQAEIKARTERYRTDGRLDPAAAEQRARDEVGRERQATTYGEQRDLFATAFSDGIRAALSGDLQGFLSNQFGNFADTMFKKAGEQIYDATFGGVSAATEGAAQGAAVAGVVTPAIVGAGATAGATMAASITAAGAAAGASMAAAIVAANAAKIPFLPGFSSGGWTGAGPVHQAKGVVHAGEVVWSQRDVARAGGVAAVEAMRRGMPGYASGGVVGRSVLPQVNSAVARVQGATRARQEPVIVRLSVDEGALFVPRIEAVSGRVAVQATASGVAYSQDQQRTMAARRRQSLIG